MPKIANTDPILSNFDQCLMTVGKLQRMSRPETKKEPKKAAAWCLTYWESLLFCPPPASRRQYHKSLIFKNGVSAAVRSLLLPSHVGVRGGYRVFRACVPHGLSRRSSIYIHTHEKWPRGVKQLGRTSKQLAER